MASRRSRGSAGAWRAFADGLSFVLDCQEVIGRRVMRLSRGDRLAFREAGRMLAEKPIVATIAQLAAAFAWPLGAAVATEKATATYRRAVSANRRRLSRGD